MFRPAVLLLFCCANVALAQGEEARPGIIVSPPSHDGAPAELAWKVYADLELELKVKRTRIAAWSTAGVLLGGLITFSVGLTQCTEYVSENDTRVSCNRAGQVLEPTGRALMYGGAVGLLTSGIMLAVRNKKRRESPRAAPSAIPAAPSDRQPRY